MDTGLLSGEAVPRVVGRFEVRRELGAGAFGRVYLAFDPQLEREVALKVPHPGAMTSERTLQRFLGEAKAAARLRHPHIVSVFDAGLHGSLPYLAAEFIRGKTLQQVLEEERLDIRRSAEIVLQLAEALAYAHGEGIIHRDIKPANVMMDEHGRPHVMDFGLALREELESRLTQEGTVLGTPAYMSPEQASGQGSRATSASDQYSLGILLYELLCGEVPFHGPAGLVLSHQIHQEPPPLRSHRPDIPRDLETICLKALAKRVQDRYPDCQELSDDLRRWMEGEPVRARRLALWERSARWCRRNPLLAALTGAIALLLVAVAGVSVLSAARLAAAASRERDARNEAQANEAAARLQAELARQSAEQARASAEQARQQQARAEAEEERSRRLLYFAEMGLARQAWERGQVGHVLRLLRRQEPAAGKADLRDFEWYHLWNLCRQDRLSFRGHRDIHDRPAAVTTVAFAPDGKRLASASRGRGNEVLVWEADTGKVQFTRTRSFVPGSASTIERLAFIPGTARLALWNGNQELGVWDSASDTEQGVVVARHNVAQGALSGDGQRYAGALYDAESGRYVVAVWDTMAGKELTRLSCPPIRPPTLFTLYALAMNADGSRVAAAGSGGSVHWWETAKGGPGTTLSPADASVEQTLAIVFSPEGALIAAGRADHQVLLWELATSSVKQTLDADAPVQCLAFSRDGHRLAAGTGKLSFSWPQDSQVRVWDVPTGRELATLVGHEDVVTGVFVSPDGSSLASSSRDGTVRLWDLPLRPERRAELELPVSGDLLAFSANGKFLVSGSPSGGTTSDAALIDASTGQLRSTFRSQGGYVTAVALSPDGRMAALACSDHSIRLYDAASGRDVRVLGGLACSMEQLIFSPDGRQLLAAGKSGAIGDFHIWDVGTGEAKTFPSEPPGIVFAARWGPDGRAVLAVQSRTDLRTDAFLWDVATGQKVLDLSDNSGEGGRFSLDGKRLAVIGHSLDRIRIYDTASGEMLSDVRGHKGQIRSLDFTPDGQTLVSASDVDQGRQPGEVKLWDAATGLERATWQGEPPVAFSSDGQRLAWKRGRKGPLVLWRAATRPEIAAQNP